MVGMSIDTTFNPALHPRSETGKFTESHGSAPESGLTAPAASGAERERVLDALDALASAQAAYTRRPGFGRSRIEETRDFEDLEDARLAFADEAEAVIRARVTAGTATPAAAKLIDDLDHGRSSWEPGSSLRDDERLEDASLDFADGAETFLEDETMPVLTITPTSATDERHAAVRATFPWADDDAVAAIAKGEPRQRATPPEDWFEDPDAPVLCTNCGSELVSNFEGQGRWGHAAYDDAACYDREWHAAAAAAAAVAAAASRDVAPNPGTAGRLREWAIGRIREAGTR